MKKIFTAATIALFMMTSCSDDDSSSNNNNNNNNNTDSVLLKKMIVADSEGDNYTAIFEYNGTKLKRINYSDGSYEIYSYTDAGITFDLIQSQERYNADGELTEEVSYLYNTNNKLEWAEWSFYDGGDLEVQSIKYTHNTDGTITWEDYANTSYVVESGKIYQNKFEINVSAFEEWPDHIDISTYTYDGKNHPLKNVTGYDKISFAGSDEGLTWSQNTTSEIHSNTLGVNELMSSTTYTYNSDNYPVTSEENEMDYITNTQYFYE